MNDSPSCLRCRGNFDNFDGSIFGAKVPKLGMSVSLLKRNAAAEIQGKVISPRNASKIAAMREDIRRSRLARLKGKIMRENTVGRIWEKGDTIHFQPIGPDKKFLPRQSISL